MFSITFEFLKGKEFAVILRLHLTFATPLAEGMFSNLKLRSQTFHFQCKTTPHAMRRLNVLRNLWLFFLFLLVWVDFV